MSGAKLIRELRDQMPETEIVLEYSPESFTGTELDFAVSDAAGANNDRRGPLSPSDVPSPDAAAQAGGSRPIEPQQRATKEAVPAGPPSCVRSPLARTPATKLECSAGSTLGSRRDTTASKSGPTPRRISDLTR